MSSLLENNKQFQRSASKSIKEKSPLKLIKADKSVLEESEIIIDESGNLFITTFPFKKLIYLSRI